MNKRGLKVGDVPNAMVFWDSDSNIDIDPNSVAAGSEKKYHWRCPVAPDHHWIAPARALANQQGGCPYCANRLLSKTNALSNTHPELALEFDIDLNGLKPNEVISGSDKKYWWRCQTNLSHVWQANMNKRTKAGRGCPYCRGLKVLPEESFGSIFPSLMDEWDWEKNTNINPMEQAPKSDKYAWWICSSNKDHQWKAKLNNRANGTGCPYCANKRASSTNSLLAVFPQLASQFDLEKNYPLTPDKITSSSTKKCWWKCEVNPNHSWEASPNHRRGGENGCPFCSTAGTSKPELRLISELGVIFSDIKHRNKINGLELDLFIPSLNLGIEYDGVYYHKGKEKRDQDKTNALKKLGIKVVRFRERPLKKLSEFDILIDPGSLKHSDLINFVKVLDDSSFNLPKSRKSALSKYSSSIEFMAHDEYLRLISEGRKRLGTSLSDTHPELIREWDSESNFPLVPENFTAGSSQSVHWICSDHSHHKWEATITHRALQGTACPFCTRVKTAPEHSFIHDYPQIAAEWHPTMNDGLDIESFSKTSKRKKVWWQCSKNSDHEWLATVSERCRGNGLNCPYCGNKRISDTNSLFITHPILAEQWHPTKNGQLTPKDVFAGGKQKVWWLCPVATDHEWEAALYSRSGPGGKIKNGCPYCSGRRASSTNNLSLTNPSLMAEWDFIENLSISPESLTQNSKDIVSWICTKDHEHKWSASIKARVQGKGCPFCKGKEFLPGKSLNITHPALKEQWDNELNQNSIESYGSKSSIKVWWHCPVADDHIWQAAINKRALPNGDVSDCPFCTGRKTCNSNSIASTHPELSKQWHPTKNIPLKPNDVSKGSGKKVWWQCKNSEDHVWETAVHHRAGKDGSIKSGCPYCAGQRACKGNNIQDLFPELLEEWDFEKNFINPSECLPYTNKKFWWICKKGHSWETSAISRTKFARGCPVCN